MRKILTNKKIVPVAVFAALLFCGLIFTTCGKLESDENIYTITFIAEYTEKETKTERRVVEINSDGTVGPNNGKILKPGEVYNGPGEVKTVVIEEVEVHYNAFTGEEVIPSYAPGMEPTPVTRRTDGDGRLAKFPPNPARQGWSFDGWFTEGGTRVTINTIFTTHTRVHAVWKGSIQDDEGFVALRFAGIREDLEEGGANPSGYTVKFEKNEALFPITLVNEGAGNIRIILEGTLPTTETETAPVLTLSESGSLFTVGRGVTLVLKNARMEGNDRNTTSLLTVNQGGTLIIGENDSDKSYIALNGAEDEKSGGGVTVNTGGELIMNGGVIYECTAIAYPYNDPNGWPGGGGVLVRGGTFTMAGGNIERCYGRFNGGGVLVDRVGRFTMTGGQIYDNTAPYGGGVSTYRGGLFVLKGGTLKENLAGEGGGVFVDTGAEHTIPYDPRRDDGYVFRIDPLTGKTDVNDPAKKEGFYMEGGFIEGNHAVRDGGGVANYAGGIVFMTGGTIRTNLADDFGGGVMNMGLFIMLNGNIQSNRASFGAGVMAALNMFAFEAGNITANQASSAGAGVFCLQGTFSMLGADALLANNIARGFGGGVAVYPDGVFAMAGGTIRNNTDQNYNEGTVSFFESSDPKLLGFALFGKRRAGAVPGDPLIDHRGHWWKNPTTNGYEWVIDSYLVRIIRDTSNPQVYPLVTELLPWKNSCTITVVNGVLSVTGGTGSGGGATPYNVDYGNAWDPPPIATLRTTLSDTADGTPGPAPTLQTTFSDTADGTREQDNRYSEKLSSRIQTDGIRDQDNRYSEILFRIWADGIRR